MQCAPGTAPRALYSVLDCECPSRVGSTADGSTRAPAKPKGYYVKLYSVLSLCFDTVGSTQVTALSAVGLHAFSFTDHIKLTRHELQRTAEVHGWRGDWLRAQGM